MKSLQYYWYHRNVLVWFLLPLSWLYCLVISLRRKLYQAQIKQSYGCKVPVVVVGNIVVGGSGKTPLLIALCGYMREQGYNPGVVSRGYGGSVSGVHQVTADDPASLVGDEPLMIFQRTNVAVVVAVDRAAAVNHLVSHNRCDIVFSDDGLQHYRMQRDYEVVVIDSSRQFGNGFCLPAGPLREPLSRLNDVDMKVYNDTGSSLPADESSYSLSSSAVNRLDDSTKSTVDAFIGQTVHAVAGIGNPQRFFQMLQQQGIDIIEHAFPDHHSYTQEDFSGWSEQCIIMTEKDAVKCRHLRLPDAWMLQVSAVFSDRLKSRLDEELLPLVKPVLHR